MPNKSKTVVSSKEQLKELGKCLRSTKPDILTDAIKKVNLDFINTDNSVPTLLNNLRPNNKPEIIKSVILKFAELLSLHPEPLKLALEVMTEGEKSTTKWEGCERFSAFLNDEDPAVQVAAVRCIKFVMQSVYKLPPEEDEKRAKYTENIFIKSDPVYSLTTHLGNENQEVRSNALHTLYYLTPTEKNTQNTQLLEYTPKVFEIMYSNPECSNYLSKFYPNPEEVSDENRIALYLLDGICQYKESHPQISNVFDIYVAAIRRSRLSFIEQIPIMDLPRDDNGNIIYSEEDGGGKKMNKKESTDTLKSQKSKNASKKSLKDDLKSNNDEEFESAASLGIPKEIFNFNILLEWSYWAVNTTCSTLCTVLPNELVDNSNNPNPNEEESKENETKESEKVEKKEKKGKVEEEVPESENDKLKKIVFRLLREINRLIENINSKHCSVLFHRVLDGLIELFKPRKWVRDIAKDARMLKVLLRQLKDNDFEIRNKIEVLLTLLCKYEKEEEMLLNNNENREAEKEERKEEEYGYEEGKIDDDDGYGIEEESKMNENITVESTEKPLQEEEEEEKKDNEGEESKENEECEKEKVKIHTIVKPSTDEEIQTILKGEEIPYLNVNLIRSLLESEQTDLDMKCRICRFVYLIIKNEDNASVIISADIIPVLLQVLLPVYPIEDEINKENEEINNNNNQNYSEETKIEPPLVVEESKQSTEGEEKKDDNGLNEEVKVNEGIEREECKEMEQSESNVTLENPLEPLTPLHYNIYISIIKTLNYLICFSPKAHFYFRNGLISPYNIDDYVETDYESDTEIDDLIVANQGKGGGAKKPKPKKEKPKAPKKEVKKGAGGKDSSVITNASVTPYPLVDVIIQWMKNISPEWKYEIQTTSAVNFIEHCPLFTLSMELINNLSKGGNEYIEEPLENPIPENENAKGKKASQVDPTLTQEPPSLLSSRTLLKHIPYLTTVALLPINDDNEKGILYAIDTLKEMILLPDGILFVMYNLNHQAVEVPTIENKPELVYPKKYTEEEKAQIDAEYQRQCDELNENYAKQLVELSTVQGNTMSNVLNVITRLFKNPCNKIDYLIKALNLFEPLCVCDDKEDALLLYMKDNITYKILDDGILNYFISILDYRPLKYANIQIDDVDGFLERVKRNAIYLITRGVHKTELKANPPETLKQVEAEPADTGNKKQKRNSKPATARQTSQKGKDNLDGSLISPSSLQKPSFPAGVFGPMEDDWTIVLNKVKEYEVWNIPESTPLHCAVNLGNEELVKLLIQNHGNVSISDKTGVSPLMTALSLGYDNIVDILINEGKADVNSVTVSGDPLIKFSIVSPDNQSVEDLQIKHFEGVEDSNIPSITGNSRMVLTLLKAGADPNVADSDGLFPLHMLIKGVTLNTRLKWISNGIINTEGKESNNPPTILTDTVKELIDCGAKINKVDKYGCTPLHYALSLGHVPVIKLLLDYGADVNIQDVDHYLPIHCACFGRIVGKTGDENDIVDIVKILVKNGEKRGVFTPVYDNSNLGLTQEEKKEHEIAEIFEYKYRNLRSPREIILQPLSDSKLSTYITSSGILPLHLVIGRIPLPDRYKDENMPQWCVKCDDENKRWLGKYKLCEYLLGLTNDGVKSVLDGGKTVLHNACYITSPTLAYKMITSLIKAGANVNAICQEKDTETDNIFNFSPLHFALLNDEYLGWSFIDNNCILYTPSCSPPPAHIALYKNYSNEIIMKLAQAMPDPNISGVGVYHGMDFEGSLLYIACKLNKPEIIDSLLEVKGIQPNQFCKTSDMSPLMISCLKGYSEVVEVLLRNKADSCALNYDKYNVLYYAVKGENLECIKMIMEAGAKRFLHMTYQLTGGNAIQFAEDIYLEKSKDENTQPSDLENMKEIILYLLSEADPEKEINHQDPLFETWIEKNDTEADVKSLEFNSNDGTPNEELKENDKSDN